MLQPVLGWRSAAPFSTLRGSLGLLGTLAPTPDPDAGQSQHKRRLG